MFIFIARYIKVIAEVELLLDDFDFRVNIEALGDEVYIIYSGKYKVQIYQEFSEEFSIFFDDFSVSPLSMVGLQSQAQA